MKERMHELEEKDRQDRTNGTSRMQRLRQIGPDTGKLLAILAATAPEGLIVEIGTSAGYSTMWLSLAAKLHHRKITTFELLEEKITLAKETFSKAGIEGIITLVQGDAVKLLPTVDQVGFCFLDTEKHLYQTCYDIVIPKLVKGGILVADNVGSHRDELQEFIDTTLSDTRVDACVLQEGKGLLLTRKI